MEMRVEPRRRRGPLPRFRSPDQAWPCMREVWRAWPAKWAHFVADGSARPLFLAVGSGAIFLWSFFGFDLGRSAALSHAVGGMRCVLAAAVAGLLLSRVALTAGQIRAAEYALFGGFIGLMAVNQYIVDSDLLRHNDIPGEIAFIKNGVLGTIVVMVLYGMLVPNHPKTTAQGRLHDGLDPGGCADVLSWNNPMWPCSLTVPDDRVGRHQHPVLDARGGWLPTVRTCSTGCTHSCTRPASSASISSCGSWAKGVWAKSTRAAPAFEAPVCAQADQGPGGGRPDRSGPLRARSAVGGPALPPQHDRDLRLRPHRRRDVLLRHGIPAGSEPRRSVRDGGPLPAGRVIYLFRQICAGLAEAHTLGLVHRDLKPANVFVAVRGGESDVTKVLDFGLVELTQEADDQLTGEMMVSGTPLYMAPEQALADRSLDSRADIYALAR